MSLRWFVSLLAFISIPWLQIQQGPPPQPYRDKDAYTIYSLVLTKDQMWQGNRLVIRNHTSLDAGLGMPSRCMKFEGRDQARFIAVVEAFERLNSRRWSLLPMLSISKPYDLASEQEVSSFSEQDSEAGKRWRERHPGAWGYVYVSAVAFNADRTQALVSVSHLCGSLCGAGQYHLLEKKDGQWVEAKWKGEVCGWVS